MRMLLSLVLGLVLLMAACASPGRPPTATTVQPVGGQPALSAPSADLGQCGPEQDPRRSIEACTRVIEAGALSDRDRSEALVIRALGYVNLEPSDPDRALADAEAAIRADPTNSYAYRTRGLAYAQKDQHERALADYDTAIRIDPNEGYHYFVRGAEYLVLGRDDDAACDFRKAKELDLALATTIDVMALQGVRMLDTSSPCP